MRTPAEQGQSPHFDVIVVGTGHGGAQVATVLRQRNFVGSIALVGEEPDLPYERPPLSKDYLTGEKSFERILIRPARFWDERNVELHLGQPVVTVNADSHSIDLQDGRRLTYGALVWAAGGSPRRLTCSGHGLRGVHTVRTRADVDAIMSQLASVSQIAVVGGGYIGLEAASALTKLGKNVIVLEAQDRVLARVAGEKLARFFEEEHRNHGVEIRTGVNVQCIEEDCGRACGVRLADGSLVSCDLVIVGIGIVPAVAPLLEAGCKGGNGVIVDAQCRTSLPDIFAIGDCACHPNKYADGASIRLESVQNANDQATIVAKALTGVCEDYDAVPWFWSDQFDLKLQTVGISQGHDQVVVRGDPATRSFSLIYLKEAHVIALDCVNATRDYVQGRGLVLAQTRVACEDLENMEIPLKSLVSVEQH